MFINLLKKIYYEKYSKSSVDLIIGRLFSNKSNGIYIDVGCNHPIKYKNTYLLHKKGWNGIKIDLIVTECVDISQQEPETHTQSLEYIINTNLYKLSDLFFVKKSLDLNAI
jgi:hypothetical protein|tara:strand:- start:53 stop:385 length:333 start_codon:yes stop_codon:yes gene_type:complete